MQQHGPDSISALDLAANFAAGTTTPSAFLEICLARAKQVPYVFITLTKELARQEASAATQRWRAGKPLSMLDGVPITWKDLIDVSGTVTTAGSAVRKSLPPAQDDAPVVAQARRFGLIGIGKTNLTEFAYSGIGYNPHFGTPANPTQLHGSLAPGGSSSGAAISVACGIAPLAMATDTAGSIRVPAAFNGLVGYKSSSAHYDKTGVFPLAPTLDSLGTIAHTVADCIALDRVLLGRPFDHIPAIPLASTLSFAVDEAWLQGAQLSDAVRRNLEASIDKLSRAGASILVREMTSLRAFESALKNHGWLGAFEAFAQHRELLSSPQAALLDPRVRSRLEAARDFPEATYLRLLDLRRQLMTDIQTELDDSTLLLPTVAHTAPELAPLVADPQYFADVNLRTLRITMFGNFLDLAAITLPNGTDHDSLPTGMQLLRPSGQDEDLSTTALAVEQILQQ
jgi:aspartyl-tRNA(Asn)/glutamyl-tRNA(Gln) amidotransferase subunit A